MFTVPAQQIVGLCRLADTLGEVNWSARYRANAPLLNSMLPSVYEFLDRAIRRVTFDPRNLRATVGLSGGLDSGLVALLVAETMRQALIRRSVSKTSLILLGFRAMSEDDLRASRLLSHEIAERYPDIGVTFVERDLWPSLTETDQLVGQMTELGKSQSVYSGELPTRLMSLLVLEYADRTGHCAVDTTNGSEVILGEIVLGSGGECCPVADLYKSQLYELAGLLGLPESIMHRRPVNSTFGNDKIASYFGELPEGATPQDVYAVLDPALYLIYERRCGPETITRRLGHSMRFSTALYRRIKNQDHRRRIPVFLLQDRVAKLRRSVDTLANSAIRRAIEMSFGRADTRV